MIINSQADMYGEPYLPDFNQAEFRYIVARLFRLIIRARLKCEPDFFNNNILARWDLLDCATDTTKASKLLVDADSTLELLNRNYLIRSTSGGYPSNIDTSKPAGRILAMVTSFADSLDGGDIIHQHSLIQLANKLETGDCINWNDMHCWDELEQLRNDLDLLPKPDGTQGHAPNEKDPENIFTWDNSEWVIKYDGVKKNVHSLVGLFYVWQLLRSCNRTLTASEMRSMYRKWSGKLTAGDEHDPETTYNRFVYESTDIIGKNAIIRRLKVIDTILCDAAEGKSSCDEDKHKIEKIELQKKLRECESDGSCFEQLKKHYKKDQDQVRNSLNNALKKLKDIMPSLYKHLMSSIRMKPQFSYQPETPKTWTL